MAGSPSPVPHRTRRRPSTDLYTGAGTPRRAEAQRVAAEPAAAEDDADVDCAPADAPFMFGEAERQDEERRQQGGANPSWATAVAP